MAVRRNESHGQETQERQENPSEEVAQGEFFQQVVMTAEGFSSVPSASESIK
jgi:hypothetical protein